MPLVARGPLAGFYLPDYAGGSIVNLLASIIRSRGGRSPHPDLDALPAAALAPARRVVYLVVDGLGAQQLSRFLERSPKSAFFAAHAHRTISTVCPATTAAAVTTFATGATPAEHAILGWHLHLHDLGLVSAILPAVTRTGVPLAGPEFDLARYLQMPSHLGSTRGQRELLSWGPIPVSRFSRVGTRWSRRRTFTTLAGMERQVLAFARGRGRGLAYAYWPGHDTLCHAYGCDHAHTLRHLREIDAALARLARGLRGSGTALVVTADHGLVDAPAARRIELRDVRGLYDTLAAIPSGDARQMHCFVRPARVPAFLRLARRLERACACVAGADLVASGAFGPGAPHPALACRVGDFVLLARDGWAMTASLPGGRPKAHLGNHGGLSPREVLVPLFCVAPG